MLPKSVVVFVWQLCSAIPSTDALVLVGTAYWSFLGRAISKNNARMGLDGAPPAGKVTFMVPDLPESTLAKTTFSTIMEAGRDDEIIADVWESITKDDVTLG